MAFIPFAAALASAAGTSAATAGFMIASTAAMVAGTAVTAIGQRQAGKAAQREANYQAAVEDNNAIRAGYAAIQEGQAAEREQAGIRDQGERAIASSMALTGASGLTIAGSANDAISDTSIQIEREIQMSRYRGEMGAYNMRNQATDFRTSATLRRMSGANARRSANLSSFGTLLSGAGQAAGGMASFRK